MKLLTVVGARPQFIKAAMVSRAILTWNERKPENRHIREVLVHTGQHYHDEMSGTFFRELDIPPARVELVSPYTKAQSGFSCCITRSSFSSIRPVCCPWGPDPTPRL